MNSLSGLERKGYGCVFDLVDECRRSDYFNSISKILFFEIFNLQGKFAHVYPPAQIANSFKKLEEIG